MTLSSFLCNAGKLVKCVRRAISIRDQAAEDQCIDDCNNNHCVVTHEPTCSKYIYGIFLLFQFLNFNKSALKNMIRSEKKLYAKNCQ